MNQSLSKSIEEIQKLVNGKASVEGLFICGVNSLENAKAGDISFYTGSKNRSGLINTKASVVLIKRSDVQICPTNYLIVEDPYYAYSLITKVFHRHSIYVPSIKESVKIGIDSKIDPSSFVDDYVVIGDGVSIGKNVQIHSGVKIEDGVTIMKNTVIHQNVVIKHDVVIGENCEIHSGSIIGTDGFGYALNNNKEWNKIYQLGSVSIGNNVDIGANTTVDRGSIQNTIIEDGVKIDNQVQIGHNCIIKKNSIIAGCVGIAGSTIIEDGCRIGGAAMILGHLSIASNTTVSPGTMISRSIKNSGTTQTGIFPFFEKNDWLKVTVFLKKLLKIKD
jgi:UDP-3-O-[3-hydroxymyristoyl] glucosamine N-acyltransferase